MYFGERVAVAVAIAKTPYLREEETAEIQANQMEEQHWKIFH